MPAARPAAQAAESLVRDAGGNYRMQVTSLREARFKTTIRQQYDFSCGSAAVATLLTFQYGQPVSEQEVFQEMYARGEQAKIQREGFSLLDMKRFLASRGFLADGYELPLSSWRKRRSPQLCWWSRMDTITSWW